MDVERETKGWCSEHREVRVYCLHGGGVAEVGLARRMVERMRRRRRGEGGDIWRERVRGGRRGGGRMICVKILG